jgi:ubiquinone/menaquinone biosynthesis C-methylase UbiE
MAKDIAAFWDKHAKGYAKKPVKDVKSYEETLAAVAENLKPTDKVLEIGCGTGSTAVRMAGIVQKWVAADISPAMIEIAKGKDGPKNAEFMVAGADTKFDDAPFDVVTGFHILHLVPDPAKTIESLFAQLKPGGMFISKTVCILNMGALPTLFLPLLTRLGVAPNVHQLDTATLRGHMESAGFEILEQRIFGEAKQSPYIVARKPFAA